MRCAICDKTNSMNLENLPGSFLGHGKKLFYKEDRTGDYLCVQCIEEIRDTLSEFRDGKEREEIEEDIEHLPITYL